MLTCILYAWHMQGHLHFLTLLMSESGVEFDRGSAFTFKDTNGSVSLKCIISRLEISTRDLLSQGLRTIRRLMTGICGRVLPCCCSPMSHKGVRAESSLQVPHFYGPVRAGSSYIPEGENESKKEKPWVNDVCSWQRKLAYEIDNEWQPRTLLLHA